MPIKKTDWQTDRSALQLIRNKVFIQEQGISQALEWDSQDLNCVHFIFQRGTHPVGSVRIIKGNKISRLAVIKEYRNQNIGSQLLECAERYIFEHEHKRSILEAQAQAFSFYQKNGYLSDDKFLWDAGIAHIKMHKLLAKNLPVSHQYRFSLDKQDYRIEDQDVAQNRFGDQGYVLKRESSAAVASWIQIACLQSQRRIVMHLNDLHYTALRCPQLQDSLMQFIHASQRSEIIIHYRACADYFQLSPILQYCADHAKSRVKVFKQEKASRSSYLTSSILFDECAYILFDQNSAMYQPSAARMRLRKLSLS